MHRLTKLAAILAGPTLKNVQGRNGKNGHFVTATAAWLSIL